MTKSPENQSNEITPERPLECSECRRPIHVHYTEIVGGNLTCIGMCDECPELQKRLKGVSSEEKSALLSQGYAGLACGNCGTTLDSVRIGHQLGCAECYEIFNDVLDNDIFPPEKMPKRTAARTKTQPLHVGRGLGQTQEMSPSLKLLALNDALNETLKREDYEQAALLRDQIRALTEKTELEEKGKGERR